MSRASASSKGDTFTFRLDPALKAALAAAAAEELKPPGELLRQLVRQHIAAKERRAFEAEARRQCAIINAAAQDPNSDEAQVMRDLDAHLDDLGDEWT